MDKPEIMFPTQPEVQAVYEEALLWGCTRARAFDEAVAFSQRDYLRGYTLGSEEASKGIPPQAQDAEDERFREGYEDAHSDYAAELRYARALIAEG